VEDTDIIYENNSEISSNYANQCTTQSQPIESMQSQRVGAGGHHNHAEYTYMR